VHKEMGNVRVKQRWGLFGNFTSWTILIWSFNFDTLGFHL